MSELAS